MSTSGSAHWSVGKSERVLRLTASCIRTAVRLRLGHNLSFDDAMDLARLHDVQSAVNSLEAKLEVHDNVPDRVKISVAVSEAKLSNTVSGAESVEHIIKIRSAAFGTGMAETQTAEQRESLINALQALRREANQWADGYQRFSGDLFAIYENAVRQLKKLPLTGTRRTQAMTELETIITDAIRRGSP